jgi:hypothetical protein
VSGSSGSLPHLRYVVVNWLSDAALVPRAHVTAAHVFMLAREVLCWCRGIAAMEDEGTLADHTSGIASTDGRHAHHPDSGLPQACSCAEAVAIFRQIPTWCR